MNRLIFASFLALFFNFSALGDTLEKPFLWKAEKDGKMVYLLGTIHIGSGLNVLPKEIFPFLDSSSLLFVEADISSPIDPSLQQKMMFYQGDESLEQHLSPAAWEILKRELSTVSPDVLKKMKPWVVVNFMTMLAASQVQWEGRMDQELVEYAQNQSIPVDYLESIETQLASLDGLVTVDALEESLIMGTSLLDDVMGELLNMDKCYQSSNLGCIEKIIQEGYDENSLLESSMKKRNKYWIPVIEGALLKEKQIFVAAGVSHFVLEDNVLELLKQRGYHIERVKRGVQEAVMVEEYGMVIE